MMRVNFSPAQAFIFTVVPGVFIIASVRLSFAGLVFRDIETPLLRLRRAQDRKWQTQLFALKFSIFIQVCYRFLFRRLAFNRPDAKLPAICTFSVLSHPSEHSVRRRQFY